MSVSTFIGSTSAIFWGLVMTAALNIWAAEADGPDDLISLAVARGLVDIFGQISLVLTPGFILNTFFLHQRGKAVAVSSTLSTLATLMGPSSDGFQVQVLPRSETFWWQFAGSAFAAVLVFAFIDETAFNREQSSATTNDASPISRTWLRGRIATFFPGN
ncbi:MAG: hypothetical protein Q9162_006912 [Coniocarpon cinnabarinum]